jgi:hypothetical protein
MKKIIIIIILIINCAPILAYKQHMHKYITGEGYNLLKLYLTRDVPGLASGLIQLQNAAWNEDVDDPVYHLRKDNPPTLTGIVGVIDDAVAACFGGITPDGFVSSTHFWYADYGDDVPTTVSACVRIEEGAAGVNFQFTVPNAYQKIKLYKDGGWDITLNIILYGFPTSPNGTGGCATQRAIVTFRYNSLVDLYKNKNLYVTKVAWIDGSSTVFNSPIKFRSQHWSLLNGGSYSQFIDGQAFNILGRMCHLLQDMSVPAHSNIDPHGDNAGLKIDTYEDYFGEDFYWNADNTNSQIGGFINPYQSPNPVHFLMYTTNQIANHFASNGPQMNPNNNTFGGDGNTEEISYLNSLNLSSWGGPSDMNGPWNQTTALYIRDKMLPQAIRATAGLLYWFARECHLITNIKIINNFSSGIINVNGQIKTSPYETNAFAGDIFNLYAIEQTDQNNYQRSWNTTTNYFRSYWQADDVNRNNMNVSNGNSYNFTVQEYSPDVTYTANLRKTCNIYRDKKNEFMGISNDGLIATTFEQNPTQIASPINLNQGTLVSNFSYWDDNLLENRERSIITSYHDTKTAVYKTINHSDNNTNYQKNGQRRFVQTRNGILHKVYESMGTVWYEQSTDQGATWTIANGGKPLELNASNPCIENSGDNILIGYQVSSNTVKVQYFKYEDAAYSYKNSVEYEYIVPVIVYPRIAASSSASGYPVHFLLLLHREDIGNMILTYGYSDENLNSISLSSAIPLYINRTGAVNSSISCLKEATINKFHLAWEENGNIYYCPIFYNNGSNEILTKGNIDTTSKGSGFINNRQPSVTVIRQPIEDVKIMWIGDQYAINEGGDDLSKTLAGKGYVTKALYRSNYANSDKLVWSPFLSFGNDVCSVNINSAVTSPYNYYYLLGWSESNGAANKCINNSFVQINTIKQGTTNLTGKYLQMCNGSYLSAQPIYASIFDESALPYQFKTSNSMDFTNTSSNSSNNGSAKETVNHGLSTSRGGVAYKDNAQFYFSLGDVLVNNNKVNFVHLPDSINFNNLAEVNNLLSTEPFELSNNTPFSFSIQYGLTDSSAATALLSNGKTLNFKVVLYDVESNQILGEYDNVTYNSSNVYQYENVNNLVNTSGINYHKVVLKLVMSGNFDCSYSIAGSYSDDYALNKVSSKHIDLKNSTIVTEYGISQNYPNPFNPATTINYQLPSNSMVTIKVYDILGNEIKTLVNEYKQAGRYNVSFDASKLSSGVYIYRITAGDYSSAKKMTLVK